MMKLKIIIPIFILISLLFASSAYAATIISSCPYNVTASGKYELNQNIESNGTCIQLKANNIEIDCKGFSITGNNSGAGIYNWRSRNNATFKNCNIHNFTYGIQFTSVPSDGIDYDAISDITYDNLTIDTPTAIYMGEDGDSIDDVTLINSELNSSSGTGFTSRAGNGGKRFRNFNVTNNNFNGRHTGIYRHGGRSNDNLFYFNNNDFSDCTYGIRLRSTIHHTTNKNYLAYDVFVNNNNFNNSVWGMYLHPVRDFSMNGLQGNTFYNTTNAIYVFTGHFQNIDFSPFNITNIVLKISNLDYSPQTWPLMNTTIENIDVSWKGTGLSGIGINIHPAYGSVQAHVATATGINIDNVNISNREYGIKIAGGSQDYVYVDGLDITNSDFIGNGSGYGIHFTLSNLPGYLRNANIANNEFIDLENGIYRLLSKGTDTNLDITNNNFYNISSYGIYAYTARPDLFDNPYLLTISENRFDNSSTCMYFRLIDDSDIFNNNMSNSNNGIQLYGNYNDIYYNNFINITNENAHEYSGSYNEWDDGVCAGNYWGTCTDNNNDDFCDSDYTFTGNYDDYPLATLWPGSFDSDNNGIPDCWYPPIQTENCVSCGGTNLSNYNSTTIQNVSSYTWFANGYTKVKWNQDLNLFDVPNNNLDNIIQSGEQFFAIDKIQFPEMNKPATITFYNVSCDNCNGSKIMYASGSYFSRDYIRLNGVSCSSVGKCSDFSCTNPGGIGDCTFNVTGFSGYAMGGTLHSIPEFTDYAIMLIILTAICGFFVVKKKKGI